MKPPEGIRDFCRAFLRGLNAALGEKLYGVYLYGAAAFPESGPTGDIDFHVILTGPLTDEETSSVNDLHEALAGDFPPLGAELDGYYLLLAEARQTPPPRHQLRPDVTDNAWALHREHIRAGRCITLQGPDPTEVYTPASWPELEDALHGELRYVESHLGDYPDYCILNLCRLMYSFETQDVVVPKTSAAAWAWDTFPRWRRHIELAKKSYAGEATLGDRQFMTTEAGKLYRFACDHIRKSRRGRRRQRTILPKRPQGIE